MSDKRYEVDLRWFDGFYGTEHGFAIDNLVEQELEYRDQELNEDISDIDFDYPSIRQQYANEYVKRINDALPPEIDLQLQEIVSPREYNFVNDRLMCTLSEPAIRFLVKAVNRHTMRRLLIDAFTSYDGFYSFYSNDIDEWYFDDVLSWDHNELGALLEAYMVDKQIPTFEEITELMHESIELIELGS